MRGVVVYAILAAWIAFASSQALPNVTRIGGLFDSNDEEQEMAFHFAVDRINDDTTVLPRSNLVAQDEKIGKDESFRATKKAKPEPPILEENGRVLRNGETVGPYYEDDTLTLECKSKGGKPAPEVTWWRGNEQIPGKVEEQQDSLGRSTVTNSLSLALTREHIGSKFECRVENEAIKDEPLVAAVELKLLVQPKSMKVRGPSKPVVAGDSVTLTCTIDSAVPPAIATWFNRSDPMNVEPEEQRTDNDDGTYTTISRLNFKVSRFDHLGTFYCKGSNKVMQSEETPPIVESLDLQVLYPPVVVAEPSKGIMVNENDSTEIYCTYVSNPSNFTEVVWYKNGIKIVTKDNPKYAVNNPGYPALKIIHISRNDYGLYSCSLSNSIGRGNSSNYVDIDVHCMRRAVILILGGECSSAILETDTSSSRGVALETSTMNTASDYEGKLDEFIQQNPVLYDS